MPYRAEVSAYPTQGGQPSKLYTVKRKAHTRATRVDMITKTDGHEPWTSREMMERDLMRRELHQRKLRQYVQSAVERVRLRAAIAELESSTPTLSSLLENFDSTLPKTEGI